MPMPVAGRLGRSSPFWVDFDALDGLDRNGLPIFRSGQTPTFARGGTVNTASATDQRGRVHVVGASTPQLTCGYDAATGLFTPRGLRLEPQRKNVVLSPNDFGTSWTAVGTPTRVAAAASLGAVVLDLLGDDDGAAQEYYRQDLTYTGDGVKSVLAHWRAGTSPAAGGSCVQLYDVTAAVERLGATITNNAGAPSVVMANGAYLGSQRLADGSYVLAFASTSVTAANTNRLSVLPVVVLGQTGNAYLGGIQSEDARYPSSFIPQAGTALTRSAATLTIPFNATLADFTVLITAAIPWGFGVGAIGNLLNIGANTDGAEMYVSNASVIAEIRGTPNTPVAGQAITPGGLFTAVAQFANWGSAPVCRLDVGAGFGAWSSASNARSALGAALLTLNGGSNGAAVADYRRLIVAPSSWTRDQLSVY
jgi:hypothetical protein